MRIGERVRRIRKLKKRTLEQVALTIGTDTGNLSRMETGKQAISEGMLGKLAAALGVRPVDFFTEGQEADARPARPPPCVPQTLPIVGTVAGGDDGYFDGEYKASPNEGSLPFASSDAGSYALRVQGSAFSPRIRNGEFIIIQPTHYPLNGDDVVVIFKDGRKMLKVLLYTRYDEATFGSVNGVGNPLQVSSADIKEIYFVAAIVPRGAFIPADGGIKI
jgi:transcriptional regulator with XRE-family HTH domain